MDPSRHLDTCTVTKWQCDRHVLAVRTVEAQLRPTTSLTEYDRRVVTPARSTWVDASTCDTQAASSLQLPPTLRSFTLPHLPVTLFLATSTHSSP